MYQSNLNQPLPDFEAICCHFAEDPTHYRRAVVPPIFQNSLFTFPNTNALASAFDGDEFYFYTRLSNPTTEIAEAKIAALEGAEKARCFGSGMGAISGAILSCVKTGDHIVAPRTIYGPTRQFLSQYLSRFQVEVTYIHGDDPEEWHKAIRANTRLFYLETPSTAIMRQQDLSATARIAKEHEIVTICDNSWASPIFQSPILHGIDLVLHSATKYLGGHSDIVAGVVAGERKRIDSLIQMEGGLLGAVLDPFAAWLLLRGLRTLPIRMAQHHINGMEIAKRLASHPKVAGVYYPGGEHDTQCGLTKAQLRGSSGLMGITLKDSTRQKVNNVIDKLKWFQIGCSWGGFESLAMPMPVPYESLGEDRLGHETVMRLHIGLEGFETLWADLEQALAEG